MKTLLPMLALVILTSCGNTSQTKTTGKSNSNVEIYRSTEDSFQKDFYLEIENQNATIYGWALNYMKTDTLYYRSKSKLHQDSTSDISLTIRAYEVSQIKHTARNLVNFQAIDGLNLPIFGLFAHSSFWGSREADGSFTLKAVKHSYDSNFDKFRFERIK